jgi:DNA polymerase III subunit delta
MPKPSRKPAATSPGDVLSTILSSGPGAYLILGENTLEQEEIADRVVLEVLPEAIRAFNVDSWHADDTETDADAIASGIAAWPMMADARVVTMRGMEGTREAVGSALSNTIEGGVPSTYLLMLGVKLDGRRKWAKSLTKNSTKFTLDVPRGRAFQSWVERRAARYGSTISAEAANLLVDHIGNDMFRAAGELEKLAIYITPETRIDVEHVEAVVGITREDTVYQLIDRIADQNVKAALSISRRMTKADQHPAYLVGMIVRHWQALRVTIDLVRNRNEGAVGEALGEGRSFITNRYIEQARRLRLDRIRMGFRQAIAAESAIKAGWTPAGVVLDGLICQLAKKK